MLQTFKLLLPALIPSWRFFDVIAPSPRIEFTLPSVQTTAEIWQELCAKPRHPSIATMLKRLFWNPQYNDTLFLVSCAERLLENPTEHSVQQIMNRIVACVGPQATDISVQFRILTITRNGSALHKEIAYLSSVHRIGAAQ